MSRIPHTATSRKSNCLPRNGRDLPIKQQFNTQVRLCEVAPSGMPGMFKATVNGELLVESSRVPLLDACRALLAAGADSNAWIVMRHQGSEVDALRGKIGVFAKLTTKEPARGTIHFALYMPLASSPVAPPMRQTKSGVPLSVGVKP